MRLEPPRVLEGVRRQTRNDALVRKHWGTFIDVGVDYEGFEARHGHTLSEAETETLAAMIEKAKRVKAAEGEA